MESTTRSGPGIETSRFSFGSFGESKHTVKVRFIFPQEQFRFPRSKKKRIRKKWAANPANWRRKQMQRHSSFYMKPGSGFVEPAPATRCKGFVDRVALPIQRKNPNGSMGPVEYVSVNFNSPLLRVIREVEDGRDELPPEPSYDVCITRDERGFFRADRVDKERYA